jgi:DNA-binding protein YbaB
MAAKATGYLELNIAGFDQALKTAKNLMATFAAGFAGYKLGSVFKDGIKDAIDFGKSMNTVSRSMGGLGAGNLLLVQKALERTGQGAEEAQGHIADFVKSGRSISSMFGGADNYAAALSKSSKEYGDQADVLNRSAAKLQTIWNSIEVVVSKSRTFFLAMTEQFILPLQLALEKLKSINVADFGKKLGSAISDAALTIYGVFTNGDMLEAFKIGIKVAFFEGINILYKGIQKTISFLSDTLPKIFKSSLMILADSGFIVILQEAFRGIGEALSAKILSAVSNIPGLGNLKNNADAASQNADNAFRNLPFLVNALKMDKTTQKSSDEINKIISEAAKSFSDINGQPNLFDTSEDQARLQEIIAKGFQTGKAEAEEAQIDNTSAPTKGVLTSFSGASSKVIADSLAKVGGGGNFLRVGMTLSERTALDQLRAQRESNEIQKTIAKNTAADKKPATMK